MSLDIQAKSYSGQYGTETENGDIICVDLITEKEDTWTRDKEVIFVIDVSGSMEESLPNVKSSVLAFRDAILNKTSQEMANLSPEERDILVRQSVQIRLITFSNTAEELWSNEYLHSFESSVANLEVEAMTNMGDGLKLAFDKINPQSFTWIILMTDGESNEGPCRTAESFNRLVNRAKPLQTKIMALGYGDRFDPEVLNKVGTFVYVEDKERIPVVLGNIAGEVMTSVGVNCTMDISSAPASLELTEDTIIVPEGEDEEIPGRSIVNNRVIGTICSGQTYNYVYLPHGNNKSKTMLEKYKSVKVSFTDIITGKTYDLDINIEHTDQEPPEYVRDLYFNDEKKRLVYGLYKVLHKYKGKVKEELKRVREIIDTWTDSVAEPHRDEVLKLIQDIENSRSDHQTNTFLNFAVSGGFSDLNGRGTSEYVSTALTSTTEYLVSPLVRGNQ